MARGRSGDGRRKHKHSGKARPFWLASRESTKAGRPQLLRVPFIQLLIWILPPELRITIWRHVGWPHGVRPLES